MNVFTAEGISKAYYDKTLFSELDISLNEGQKMGLIAGNGSGKSTLLRIIASKEVPDSGRVSYRRGLRVNYLEQDPYFSPELSAMDCLFEPGHPVLHAIGEYEKALLSNDTEVLQQAMDRVEALNAWDYEAKAAEVLGKLGIHELDKPVGQLSGGQRKRIALARLLIEESDLLLLDEPTNHLDLDMIEWLEQYLVRLNTPLILVTHDRYFLDAVCNLIVEIDRGQVYSYTGNYAYYLERKEEREAQEQSTLEKTRNLYRRELEWMRRQPKARTTKSKSREKAFYQTEEQARGRKSESKMDISMQMSRLGSKIMEAENIGKSYDGKLLFQDFSYTFKRGEKIGLIGKNGAGKTTFLEVLLEMTRPDAGRVKKGETVIFGYYSQKGIQLPDDKRVIDVIRDITDYVDTGEGSWMNVSQFLNHFRFTGAMQHTLLSRLSGGEKKRLYLLTVLLRNPNFLVLDEPTNDLDIVTLNILEEFLEGFPGCILMVTHDRYFMDRLVDHVFVLPGDGTVRDIHGNYTGYRQFMEEQEVRKQKERKAESTAKVAVSGTAKSGLTFKEKQELGALEKRIAEMEAEKVNLLNSMNTGSGTHDDLQELARRFQDLESRLDSDTLRWLELQEKLGE